jgi:ABC-type branched-subunit amino acid transport system ATPase component
VPPTPPPAAQPSTDGRAILLYPRGRFAGSRSLSYPSSYAKEAIYEGICQFVTIDRLADEYAGNLSYGQQKLLEFTRTLMVDPTLILLDEPAAGVNRTLLNELLAAIVQLRDRGKTILLVEHDMKVVMGLCEAVFVLDHGEKIAEGPPELIQAEVKRLYLGG